MWRVRFFHRGLILIGIVALLVKDTTTSFDFGCSYITQFISPISSLVPFIHVFFFVVNFDLAVIRSYNLTIEIDE